MDLNFNEIRDFSKDAIKDHVRKHVRATAFEELKEIQKTHSKSKKLNYNEMKMQEYLTANRHLTVTANRGQLIFHIKVSFCLETSVSG